MTVLKMYNPGNSQWETVVVGGPGPAGGVGSVPAATETVAGVAEIATQVEADEGTDDTRIVTPLKLYGVTGQLASDFSQHVFDATAAHAASAVAFTPTGTVAANNVQAAIAEVATEAASSVTSSSARFDIRSYGASNTAGFNNTTAITAAIAAAEPVGGQVFIPNGRWGFQGLIIVPQNVTIVGIGAGYGADPTWRQTSLLEALNATASFRFDGGGGCSQSFVIHGNDVGTGPLMTVASGSNRAFMSIYITQSNGVGLRVVEGQNNSFVNVLSDHNIGAALVLDGGTGGNLFSACHFGSSSDWNLIIDETLGAGAAAGSYGTLGPSHNTFDHCLIEYGPYGGSHFQGCALFKAGMRNVFTDCVFSGSGYEADVAIIQVNEDAVEGTYTEVIFDHSWIFGSDIGPRLGILQTAGGVDITGETAFQNLTNAWHFTGGGGRVLGEIKYVGVTNRWHPSSTNLHLIHGMQSRPLSIAAESTDFYALRASTYGDGGTRLDIMPDGRLHFGSGAGAPDVNLYRPSAGTVGTDMKFHVGGTSNFVGAITIPNGTAAGHAVNKSQLDAHAPAPADGSVTNAKLANMAAGTVKGRVVSGAGTPTDLNGYDLGFILNGIATDYFDRPPLHMRDFSGIGAAYTLQTATKGSYLQFNDVGLTVTVPPFHVTNFPIRYGDIIEGSNAAGPMTLAPGAGVTLRSPYGLVTAGAKASFRLVNAGSNVWDVTGDFPPITVSTTAPSSPAVGQLWVDTT